MPSTSLPYKRILLKLSGEILLGSQPFGICYEACHRVSQALQKMMLAGLEVGIVIGGGNIFRGINLKQAGIERTPADQMGMLATIINGLAIQSSLETLGCQSVVMSALECPGVVESFNWRAAQQHLYAGKLLIFVGGTGHPYFTTDSAAALRAIEIHANILLKATKVDGIYDKDPLKFNDAQMYRSITYSEILAQKLSVMDATCIALCRNNNLPIYVFNMQRLFDYSGGLIALLSEQNQGTLVTENPERS